MTAGTLLHSVTGLLLIIKAESWIFPQVKVLPAPAPIDSYQTSAVYGFRRLATPPIDFVAISPFPISSSGSIEVGNDAAAFAFPVLFLDDSTTWVPDSSTKTLSSPSYHGASLPTPTTMEVIKVYGRLAGQACFGRVAPDGSSCQITGPNLLRKMGQFAETGSWALSREEFGAKLDAMPFAWPLKPFGISDDRLLEKTAVMNKGAETRLYIQELSRFGLYDPRSPTGPLPTSLRPQLNVLVQNQGIQESTVAFVYDALLDNESRITRQESHKHEGGKEITDATIRALFQHKDTLDYNDFVDILLRRL